MEIVDRAVAAVGQPDLLVGDVPAACDGGRQIGVGGFGVGTHVRSRLPDGHGGRRRGSVWVLVRGEFDELRGVAPEFAGDLLDASTRLVCDVIGQVARLHTGIQFVTGLKSAHIWSTWPSSPVRAAVVCAGRDERQLCTDRSTETAVDSVTVKNMVARSVVHSLMSWVSRGTSVVMTSIRGDVASTRSRSSSSCSSGASVETYVVHRIVS